MIYQCQRCGRDFSCEEQLSFCPFCGTAYFASASVPASFAQRIVIGSDSERTVQEKYWFESQQMIHRVIRLLGDPLPHFSEQRPDVKPDCIPKEYDIKELDISGFFSRCQSASTASFGAVLSGYLKELRGALDIKSRILRGIQEAAQDPRHAGIRASLEACDLSAFEDEYSVRIAEEESRICDCCYEVAQAIGCDKPLALRPVLKYSPESDEWADPDEEDAAFPQPSDLEPWERLMAAMTAVQDTLIQTVRSNSVFILSDMDFAVSGDEDEPFDPSGFIPLLQELAAEDYDPIFGKSPDELIRVFSEAIARLSAYVNALPDYPVLTASSPEEKERLLKRRLDDYKTGCLESFLADWRDALGQELDRAYQEQRIDMIQVSARLRRIAEEL